jgi:hypothetical protein
VTPDLRAAEKFPLRYVGLSLRGINFAETWPFKYARLTFKPLRRTSLSITFWGDRENAVMGDLIARCPIWMTGARLVIARSFHVSCSTIKPECWDVAVLPPKTANRKSCQPIRNQHLLR